jgi:hypothetical protein
MPKYFFTGFLTLWCLFETQAQHTVYRQTLYWIRYQAQLNFSPSLYWTNEADNRRFIDPDVENQLIFHSRLHYKKGPWDFGGGLTLSYAFAQRPETGYKNAVTEIRPVGEATHELNIGKVILANRIRIDNRFFEMNENKSIWTDSRYVLRMRYRIQARIPLKISDNKSKVLLKVAEEIMFNHVSNFFDQNRIYVNTEFYLNDNFSIETGYIYIYQQRFGTTEFFSRNVLRFSLLHKINLYGH